MLSETLSLRKAGRLRAKEQPDTHTEAKKRKRYRQQQRVMAEVLRKKIRKVLWQATAICLSLDECKHRKIVSFRADLATAYCAQPGSHWRVGASGFSQAGVLGLLDCSKKVLSDFEEDHSVTAVRSFFFGVFGQVLHAPRAPPGKQTNTATGVRRGSQRAYPSVCARRGCG